jgi:hypothetical protein
MTRTHRKTPAPRSDGLVAVHKITYESGFDGSPVTALVAIPPGVPSLGCVIRQFGYGAKKEDPANAS